MRIATLIGGEVVFVAPDATLADVIDVLAANEIGVVVVGGPDEPLGVVSERDIVHALADRRPIESTRAVWQGPLAEGSLIGERALSTTGMPSATMLYGEWSHVTVVSWGTMEIAVDPLTKFNQGLVAVRLLLLVDNLVTNAGGFTLATSIT